MSVSITRLLDNSDVEGATPTVVAQVTLDNSYPAGGYGSALGFSAQALGLRLILGFEVIGVNTAAIAADYIWNTQTQKLQVLGTTAGVAGALPNQDLTPAVNLSTFIVTLKIWGQR